MRDVLPDDDATLHESEQAGAVERARATQQYRRAVRATGLAVSFGIAAVFVVNAFLPGVTDAERQGLLVTAALVAATGAIWFGLVPRRWFGEFRIFVASTIAELVLLTMVVLTGGVQSLYVGYLIVPAVVLILAGSVRQMLMLAVIVGGLASIAMMSALAGARLKQVNDRLGHDAGDVLLRNFGRAIKGAIRGNDVGLRMGGDECLILLPRTSAVPAKMVAERLGETAVLFPGRSGPAQFSYGIATHRPGESGDDVVARAGAALGAAKRARSIATTQPA